MINERQKSVRVFDMRNLRECTNEVYFPHFWNTSRFFVLMGSAGSGKSHFAAQKTLSRVMIAESQRKRHKFLALRKTQPAARKSVFALLMSYRSLWGLDSITKVNRTDMTFTFPGGSEIICGGLDDREKLKSIEGLTSAWMEEATEFDEQDLTQLNLRLRGISPLYKQIMLTFNPVDRGNWIFKRFYGGNATLGHDGAETPTLKNTTLLKTTYLDNRFIDDEYRQELEALKDIDPLYYQVYALGNWGQLANMIFNNWTVCDIPNNPETDEYKSFYDATISGLDFGFNHPSALVRIGIRDGDIYIYDELYETGLTNNELIERVRKMNVPKNELITADSAEPDRIKEFRQAGFRVTAAKKGKDSVKHGIDYLKRRRIYIHPNCVGTIGEIQAYKYKEDKDGNIYDEPLEFKDDAMAAMRYAIEPYRKYSTITAGPRL